MSRIEKLLAEEGAAAERTPLPAGTKGERPNEGRVTIVSLRLTQSEHRRLAKAASAAGLPLSTYLRVRALEGLEGAGHTSVEARLVRLEQVVFADKVGMVYDVPGELMRRVVKPRSSSRKSSRRSVV